VKSVFVLLAALLAAGAASAQPSAQRPNNAAVDPRFLGAMTVSMLKGEDGFQRKEIHIVYQEQLISLRKIVELLAFVGYEPYITLNDGENKTEKKANRAQIFKIGIAGFAFSNIMMLSFPDYFAGGKLDDSQLRNTFSNLSLMLSLPVLFYCASEFFISGWKGLHAPFSRFAALRPELGQCAAEPGGYRRRRWFSRPAA